MTSLSKRLSCYWVSFPSNHPKFIVSVCVFVCMRLCAYAWMDAHLCVHVHVEARGWWQVSSFNVFYLFLETGSLPEPGAHSVARLTHQQALPTILPLFPILGLQAHGHLCFLCNCWGVRLRSLCPHGKHFIHWTHLPSHSFKTTFWQAVESKGRRGIRMHR